MLCIKIPLIISETVTILWKSVYKFLLNNIALELSGFSLYHYLSTKAIIDKLIVGSKKDNKLKFMLKLEI